MAAGQSLISELLSAINVPKLRAMPAYLSEGDSLTIDDFMQSSYAADYVLDTSNVIGVVRWTPAIFLIFTAITEFIVIV